MKRITPWLAAGALVAAVAAALWGLRGTLPSLALAFFLAYLSHPFILWLERHRVPRRLSVPALFALAAGALAALLALTLPPLLAQGAELLRQLPDSAVAAYNRLGDLAAARGLPWPADRAAAAQLLRRHLGAAASAEWLQPLGTMLGGAWKNLTAGLVWLLNWLVIPLFYFFLTLDFEKIGDGFFTALPRRLEPAVRAYAARLDEILAAYLRGQLAVCACLAALYALGLFASGVRFALPIGLLAGGLSLIPYLGFWTGLLLSLIFAAVDHLGLGSWLGIFLTFALAQLLEGNFLTPRLVGRRLGLKALESILAIIVGANLAGFWGLFLAVPAAAFAKFLLGEAWKWYRDSTFYRKAEAPPEP